jgi:hypothetical protein
MSFQSVSPNEKGLSAVWVFEKLQLSQVPIAD